MGSNQGKKLPYDEDSSQPVFNAYFSPLRERPYNGPPLEYHFVDTQVTVRPLTDGFSRTASLCSEDDGHYLLLEQPYMRGYHLQHFTKIPGGMQRTGLRDSLVLVDFQGIFCRNPAVTNSNTSSIELRVEKAWLQASRMPGGILSRCIHHVFNTSHVEESIRRGAQGGERLLCVGMTGQEDCRVSAPPGNSSGPTTSVMRVDLFFEVTSLLTSEQYMYTIEPVPVKVTYKSPVMFRPVPHIACDWKGTLTQYLDQGWRLVDVYLDIPTVSQFYDPKGQDFSPTTMNALWFFEKPLSRLDDCTPRYEGKVIEHSIKVKSHSTGTSSVAGWEGVILDMGKRGWELACIVETHTMETAGLTEVILKALLFFQRPLAQPKEEEKKRKMVEEEEEEEEEEDEEVVVEVNERKAGGTQGELVNGHANSSQQEKAEVRDSNSSMEDDAMVLSRGSLSD